MPEYGVPSATEWIEEFEKLSQKEKLEKLADPEYNARLDKELAQQKHLTRDDKTGLPDKKSLALYAMDAMQERGQKYSLVAIDLRNLTAANDVLKDAGGKMLGHRGGDEYITAAIKEEVRPRIKAMQGAMYKVGGDEYWALVPTTNTEAIEKAMAEAHDAFYAKFTKKFPQAKDLPHPKKGYMPIGVGIDFGICNNLEFTDKKDVIDEADTECYESKNGFLAEIIKNEAKKGIVWIEDGDSYKKITNEPTLGKMLAQSIDENFQYRGQKLSEERIRGIEMAVDASKHPFRELQKQWNSAKKELRAYTRPGIALQDPTLGTAVAEGIDKRAEYHKINIPQQALEKIKEAIDRGEQQPEKMWQGFEDKRKQIHPDKPSKETGLGLER